MKKRAMLAFGIFIAVGLLLITVTKSPGSNAEASATQVKFIECPKNPTASYGGTDGWSTTGVEANFHHNGVNQGHMKCTYGFGDPKTQNFGFWIAKPCPTGYKCETSGTGFRVTLIK